MYKNTVLFTIFTCLSVSLLFAQSVNVNFDNISNVYTIEKISDPSEGIRVLVTNSKLEGKPMSFNFGLGDSESTFVSKVITTMKAATDNYYFAVGDGRVVSIPKDIPKYEDLEINKPDKWEDLQGLLKEDFELEGKDLGEFWKTLKADSSEEVFEGLEPKGEFILKTDSGGDVFFIADSLEPIKVTKENVKQTIFEHLFKEFDKVRGKLKPLLISKDEFDKIKVTKLNETYRFALSEFYKTLKADVDYKFIHNVVLKKDIEGEEVPEVYRITIKNNDKEKYYNLKFCDKNSQCIESEEIRYSTNFEVFEEIINQQIDKISKDYDDVERLALKELYNLIDINNEESLVAAAKEPFYKTIDSLVLAIENLETQHSGKLKLNKRVRVYDSSWNVVDGNFIVDYATVRFFNNKAKEIVLVGKLSDKQIEFTVVNVQFSVPLRSFRNTLNYVPISPNDKDSDLYLNYNDLFEYYPKEASSNYSVRNKEYRIEADSVVPIEERKLMDYFTAVVFSDFLGLNDQNANSLMQAEGRVKIPLLIRNSRWWGKISFLHALNADINASIYNGFDDNSRFITPVRFGTATTDNENTVINDTKIDTATINTFDYIKYNNLSAGIGLDFLNIELKSLSTDWSFGYGLRYYRAGLKNTDEGSGADVVKRYQLNALTHELSTNFEIRPQLNFGADLNIALNWLHGRGELENLNVKYNTDDGNDEKKILRLQLNLYSKLDPSESNGGIYARIGGFYHFGAKEYYPQLLVGYATNLSSFVNKFSNK